MSALVLSTPRFILRDLAPSDRADFVRYQMDPRYRRLYDFDEDPTRAETLFDLFAAWQAEEPRRNFQWGLFDSGGTLIGSAGLRILAEDQGTAVLGIELIPAAWGRYRIALDVIACLLEHGFGARGLRRIVGDTASGNTRVEKLARWFGARIVDRRAGPDWMQSRGWQEVDWALDRDDWQSSAGRKAMAGLPRGCAG